MCIYTVKNQIFENNLKNSSRGCATPPNVLKLDVSGEKDVMLHTGRI